MKRALAAWASLLVAGMLVTACTPPKTPPPPPPGEPPAEPSEVQVSTDPTLFPAFSTAVPDYVSRCSASSAVQVTVTAPPGTTVSVDGQPPQSGSFTAEVNRDVGQSFPIVVQPPSEPGSSHYVRCLPADFPAFTAERSGSPQAEWYVTAPIFGFGVGYPAIFDANGVPLWWDLPDDHSTLFTTVLANGNVAWTRFTGGAEERTLDGSVVRTIETVGSPSDFHDLVLLPNGNYLFVANKPICCFDLRAMGGPDGAHVLDHFVQELTPDGDLVWEWSTSDHIPVSETPPQWHDTVIGGGSPYDVYHYNSIEPTSTGYLLSYRHLNAVYHVDKATGEIDWKLGGVLREEESLTVVDDPVFEGGGDLSGQHDARVPGDGTVTLFDNGTSVRAPRVVRYALDETAGTATLVEELGDPGVPTSSCCGSSRVLADGNWVTGWGGTGVVTEMTPSGERALLLEFDGDTFVYRATPVSPGLISREELRAGMDAQYPLVP